MVKEDGKEKGKGENKDKLVLHKFVGENGTTPVFHRHYNHIVKPLTYVVNTDKRLVL